MRWPSFQRARRFERQNADGRLVILLTSLAAAVLLVLLVLVAGALVDLLDTRGELVVPLADREAAAELAGSPDEVRANAVVYQNRGLLPVVWRLRDTAAGQTLDALNRATTLLAHNALALITLLATALILAGLAAFVLDRHKRAAQRSAVSAAERLRAQLYRQAVRLGGGELLAARGGDSWPLFDEAVEQVRQGLVAWHRFWPYAPASLILLASIALFVQPWLAIVTLLYSALAWLFLTRRYATERQREILLADRARHQGLALAEELRQARFLSSFFPLDRVGESFEDRLRRWHSTLHERYTTVDRTGSGLFFLVVVGAALVLGIGGLNILRNPPLASLASTLVLGLAILATLHPLRRLEQLFVALPAADEAARDVFHYLDRQPAVGQAADAVALARLSREIALQNVTLADGLGRTLLDDVSFSLPAGSRALIFSSSDETGVGLAGLLARFFDPASGAVLFDGQDIRRGTLASVRDQIFWIVADNVIFSGTATENVTCGDRRFTVADTIEATKAVHAYDFIQRLPQGFDTIIGERGTRLNPSETMRIGLARGLLRKPAVIIIDEPPLLPDVAETELLADSIRRAAAGRWLIVVARRLPTLRAAERVLFFHEGRLAAEGSHADLMAQSELYRHLINVRFSEFASAPS